MLKSVIDLVLDIVYPKKDECIVCGNFLLREEYICSICMKDIILNNTIWYLDDKRELLQMSKREFQNLNGQYCKTYFHSVSYYSNNVKALLFEMKFRRNFYALKVLANLLKEYLSQYSLDIDVITYVPITKKKEKTKGYNHAQVLSSMISKSLGLPCKELLIKTTETREQKVLTTDKRWDNLKGSININKKYKNKIKDKKILLIDDVITSGATAFYSSEVLKGYCDNNILVLTVAKSSI